jgi:hypothetical protein
MSINIYTIKNNDMTNDERINRGESTSINVSSNTRKLLKKLRYSIHEKHEHWVSYESIIKNMAIDKLTELGKDSDTTSIQ